MRHPFVQHLIDQRKKYLPHLFPPPRFSEEEESAKNREIPPTYLLTNTFDGNGFGNVLLATFDNLVLSIVHPSLVPAPLFPITKGHSKMVDQFFAVKDPVLRKMFWLSDVLKDHGFPGSERALAVRETCIERLNYQNLGKGGKEWIVGWRYSWGTCGKVCRSMFRYEGWKKGGGMKKEKVDEEEEKTVRILIPGADSPFPNQLECVSAILGDMKFVHATCDRELMTKICELGLCDGISEESLDFHLSQECPGKVKGIRVPERHGFQQLAYRIAGNMFRALFSVHPRLEKKLNDDLVSKIVGPLFVIQIRSSWTKYNSKKNDVHHIAPLEHYANCFAHVLKERVPEKEVTLFLTSETTQFTQDELQLFVNAAASVGKSVNLLGKWNYLTPWEIAGLSRTNNLHHASRKDLADVVDLAATFDFSMMNRADYGIFTHISTWGAVGFAPSKAAFPPYAVMDPSLPFARGEFQGSQCFRPRLLVVGNFGDKELMGVSGAWPWRDGLIDGDDFG